MFTRLTIWESASAFGHPRSVGRAQIGCQNMADNVVMELQRHGYVVNVEYNMPEMTDRDQDEIDRVGMAIANVMRAE